jgi:hypothetical protein
MINSQRSRQRGYSVRRPRLSFSMLFFTALCTACVGCWNSYPPVVRPKVGPPQQAKQRFNLNPHQAKQNLFELTLDQNFKAVAPGSSGNPDPLVCLAQGTSDPNERPLGGRTSIAPYTFSTQPHIQDMYATLFVDTEICTSQTLSATDESRLQKILSIFKITKAQSLVSNLSLTGDAQGGIKYPQLVPFSYSLDNSTNKFTVATTSVAVIPWQATTAFDIGWSYNSSSSVTVGTAALFSNIVTSIAGAGGTSSLLSPAANGYLAAGNTVAQDVAAALSNTSLEQDSHHFDLRQGPDSPARSVTFRFRDLNNRPLAGVRLVVAFTNSLQTQDVIDPTTADSTHVPHFVDGDEVPPIVNVTVAGPSSGSQTLLQEISKDQAYQDLLKSTSDTTAASFLSDCTNFENDLQTTYGLNKYDTALTMGYVLSQNTLYLTLNKFYSSGCFINGRNLLNTMGINVFNHKPTS